MVNREVIVDPWCEYALRLGDLIEDVFPLWLGKIGLLPMWIFKELFAGRFNGLLTFERVSWSVRMGEGCWLVCWSVQEALKGIIGEEVDFIRMNDLQQQQHEENNSRNFNRNLSRIKMTKDQFVSFFFDRFTTHDIVNNWINWWIKIRKKMRNQGTYGHNFNRSSAFKWDKFRLKTLQRFTE